VVDNLPHETFNGEDRQLNAAIEHLQGLIKEDPRSVTPVPPHPDKSSGDNRKK
jgi:tricorn protease